MSSSYLRSPESLVVPTGDSSSLGEINTLASDPLAAAEEEKKKKKAQAVADKPKVEKQQAQQKQELTQQGTNAVAEVGTALAGGVSDAWNDTGGRIPWLHIDNKSLENKTWYGALIRDVTELTTLAVVTRKAAGAAAKIPVGAIAKPAKFLASEGTTLKGKVARNIAQGAVIGNLSTLAEDDTNLSNSLNSFLGFNISPLAIQEADSPVMKRLKNTLEGGGFDGVFSRMEAAVKGWRAGSKAVEAANNTRLTQEFIQNNELGANARILKEQSDKARGAWQQARDEAKTFKPQFDANPKDPAIKAQYDDLIKKRDELYQAHDVVGAQVRLAAERAKAKPEEVAAPGATTSQMAGTTFTTERGGSVYVVNPNGSTTRNKGASGGIHQGDVGLKDPSLSTVYVDPKAAQLLGSIYTQGPYKGSIKFEGGKLLFTDFDIKRAAPTAEDVARNLPGKVISSTPRTREIPFLSDPSVGMHPVEFGKGWKHIGTKINNVTSAQPSVKARSAEEVAAEVYNSSVKQSEKNAAKVDEQNAIHFYNKDPEFKNGPSPDASNPALYEPHERASIKPDTTPAVALRNAVRTATEVVQRDGRVGNVMTDANYDKVVTGAPDSVKKVVTQMMNRLEKDPSLETYIGNKRYSRDEMISQISSELYKTLDGFDGLDADELRTLLLKDASTYNTGMGTKSEYMNPVSQAATQVLLRATAGEIADLSNVQRSIAGVVDTARQDDMIIKRLEVLMRLNKEASYAVGKQLADRKPNWVRVFMPEVNNPDIASAKIKEDVAAVINTIRQVADSGDRRLLQTFIDAASISDGNVRTMTDLASYMKKKVGLNGWLYGSPGEQGYLLKGLTSTFFNSVLSGPRTFTKAVFQTNTSAILRPANLFVGGMLQLDGRLMSKSLHQMGAGFEAISEAMHMTNLAKKAWLAGEQGPYQRALGDRSLPFHETEEFKALEVWAQVQGTIGDRYAVKAAQMLSMHNNHWSGNYSMGIMDMGDTFTRTILGRIELKNRAFDAAWVEGAGKISPDMLRNYEAKFRDLIFDKDGVVTDKAAMMAGDEVTLTTPLEGIAKNAETLMNSVPLIRPFMMFPRTAQNAIKFVSSYTPGLNMLLKEINEVMTCSLEDAPAIMQKYGISDLAAARAAYNGRVATGMMITSAAAGLYLSGGLTGNGTMNKEEMKTMRGLGWQPRSIRIGDKWVSYEGIEPFASILALICDIGEVSDPMNQEDAFGKVGFLVGANLTNKSFLSGIGPLTELLTGNVNRSFTNVSANTLNSMFPYGGLRNWAANVFQPMQREVEDDIRQKIMNRNPKIGGLPGRTDLPAKRDVLSGKPIVNESPLMNVFNNSMPFAVNPAWNQTREILFKSGYQYRTAFNRGPNGEELTAQQRSTLTQYAADYKIEDRLSELFSTKQYKESYDLYQGYLNRRGLTKEFPPNATYHIAAIRDIFDSAKQLAYLRMRNETGENQAVQRSQTIGLLKNAASRGSSGDQQYYIDQLLKLPK